MKESDLRRFHRYLGISFAFFLLLQGGSGLLLALEELFEPHEHSETYTVRDDEQHKKYSEDDSYSKEVENHDDEEHGIVEQIHHKHGAVWNVYRILVGTAFMAMLFSGAAIFFKIQARMKKPQKK